MNDIKEVVPSWVRCLVCVVGCSVVPGLLVLSAIGSTVSASLIFGATLFAVYTASLAFRVDMAAFRTIANMLRRWTL